MTNHPLGLTPEEERLSYSAPKRADTGQAVRDVIKRSIEGWDNVVELGLLPPQHHETARCLSDELRAALANLVPEAVVEACPTPASDDQTYYSKGKDAAWYEALNDRDLAVEVTYAAQDLNDTGLGDTLDKWMPFQAMMAITATRLTKQTEALLHVRSELALFAACCAVSNKVNDTFEGTEAKAMEWIAHINDVLANYPAPPPTHAEAMRDAADAWLQFKKAYLAKMGGWPASGIDGMQTLNRFFEAAQPITKGEG